MKIELQPVAFVVNDRTTPEDDHWGEVLSELRLADPIPESAFDGIETFSHLEVIFYFDKLPNEKIVYGSRYPRDNTAWPLTGIFAQRGASRPNKLGATLVKLIRRSGRTIVVKGLDAMNGTPVLDIKPVLREFLPREEVRQPAWVGELMKKYW